MKNHLLELQAVKYNAAAINTRHFDFKPQQESFRLHRHDRIEFIRLIRGKLCVNINSSSYRLSPGEIIIIPPKLLHTGHTLDVEAEYDVLMFDVRSFYNDINICKELLSSIFEGKTIFRTITSNKEIQNCFDEILSFGDKNPLGAISKIYQLINLLYQNELSEIYTQPKNASVKKVIEYLEEHFFDEINMDVLCEEFKYTATHLGRKFKNATGLSPMTYLKIYRLEIAGRELKNGNKSVSSIASECGFSDPNYFTRCFKAHFGQTPLKYASNHPQ